MEAYIDLEGSGFTPEEFEDVKRCLTMICSIRAGSQPLDRDLGINYDGIIGYPLNVAENMLALEIADKVKIYEPRVEIDSVSFEKNTNGQMIPRIRFVRKGGI